MRTTDSKAGTAFHLWDVASVLAVASSYKQTPKAGKHRDYRVRPAPIALGLIGALHVALFVSLLSPSVASQLAPVAGWFRWYALAGSVLFLLAARTLTVSDQTLYSLSFRARRVINGIWWFYSLAAPLLSGFPLVLSIWFIFNPREAWTSGLVSGSAALATGAVVFPQVSAMLATPIVSTRPKPHLWQARATHSLWTFALISLITTYASGAISLTITAANGLEPRHELLALFCTIAVALISATIGLHRRAMERLNSRRLDVLRAFGDAIDAFGTTNSNNTRISLAIRQLLLVLTPGPFASQALNSQTEVASFEVIETVKLIGLAADRAKEARAPASFTTQAEAGRAKAYLFAEVVNADRDQILLQAPEFLERCYGRLLTGKDMTDVLGELSESLSAPLEAK